MSPRTINKNVICLHILFFERNVCLDNSEVVAVDSESCEVPVMANLSKYYLGDLGIIYLITRAKCSDVNAIAYGLH